MKASLCKNKTKEVYYQQTLKKLLQDVLQAENVIGHENMTWLFTFIASAHLIWEEAKLLDQATGLWCCITDIIIPQDFRKVLSKPFLIYLCCLSPCISSPTFSLHLSSQNIDRISKGSQTNKWKVSNTNSHRIQSTVGLAIQISNLKFFRRYRIFLIPDIAREGGISWCKEEAPTDVKYLGWITESDKARIPS